MRRRSIRGLAAAVCLVLGVSCAVPVLAGTRKKVDVIVMKNGDRITCEIKKLEFGQLEVKAPYGKGSFVINWAEVEKVESPQSFVVEAENGNYYQGTIHTDAKEKDEIDIGPAGAAISVSQDAVVGVRQFGKGMLDRIKFAVDYGFTFARSNDQTQSTLHTEMEYRTAKILTGAVADSLFARQSNAPATNRHQASAYWYRRIQGSRWYGGAFGNFLTNDSQDLRLRSSTGGGVLRNFLTTNKNSLTGQAGIVYSNERYTVPAPGGATYNSAEAVVGVSYSTFRFDSTQFVASYLLYPSLTQSGRVRSSTDISVYYKVIGDLYTRLGFYSNFDSAPPNNTAKHDYGVTTSIGWSF